MLQLSSRFLPKPENIKVFNICIMKDHRIELTLLIRKRINHMLISMRFKTPRMVLKGCIVLLAISISGCSKNKDSDNAIKDPVVLSFDKLEPVSEMSVFTGGGVQLDSHIYSKSIQNYLDRCYSLKTNTGVSLFQSKFIELTYSDGYGKAMFTFYDNGRVDYGTRIIAVKDLGDTRILKSIVTNKIKDDPIITSDLFKYQFDINSNGTYNYQYVVHGNHRSLEVSLLYYKLVQYDDKGNLKSLAFGTMHNELNESFIPKLGRFDTLAVKAYRIKYSVK